jgi:hypothetical protein
VGDSRSKVEVWKADRPVQLMGLDPGVVVGEAQGRVMGLGHQRGRLRECV